MQKLKNIWAWLVTSSVDPNKTALTVKSFLTTLGGVVVLVSPLVHLRVGNDQVTSAVDSISQAVFYILTAVSAIVMAFGFVRKVVNTDWKNQPPTAGPMQ